MPPAYVYLTALSGFGFGFGFGFFSLSTINMIRVSKAWAQTGQNM
jgi:hypothetical protein